MAVPDLSALCKDCLDGQCEVHTPGQREKAVRKADVLRRKAEAEAKMQSTDAGEGVGRKYPPSRRSAAAAGSKKPPVIRRSWRAVASVGWRK